MILRALAIGLLVASSLASAAGKDDLWEITTKMEMAGMPAMPGQTSKVCTPKGQTNEASIPHDENCKVQDFKQSGNKRTFKMVCTGENPMTGSGEFVTDGPNAYHGTMRMQGSSGGESFDMTNTFSSKRIDSCTYEDLGKKAQAMADANTAQTCRGQMESLYWQMYTQKDSNAICSGYQKEFCGYVSKLGTEMRDPDTFTKQQKKDWKGAMTACKQNPDTVQKEACSRAVSTSNWNFVGGNCPAETEQLAKQHCAGRDYTAMRSSPYAPLCSQVLAANKGKTGTSASAGTSAGGVSTATSASTTDETAAAPTDSTGQALELGKKALKGLLSF